MWVWRIEGKLEQVNFWYTTKINLYVQGDKGIKGPSGYNGKNGEKGDCCETIYSPIEGPKVNY